MIMIYDIRLVVFLSVWTKLLNFIFPIVNFEQILSSYIDINLNGWYRLEAVTIDYVKIRNSILCSIPSFLLCVQ